MMEGIRILAEIPIYITKCDWGWSWGGFAFGVFALLFLAGAIIGVIEDADVSIMGFLGFIICLIFSLFAFSIQYPTKIFDHTEYKVLISEEVNFIELNEKYEIVNQEGEIFTIIEKPQD